MSRLNKPQRNGATYANVMLLLPILLMMSGCQMPTPPAGNGQVQALSAAAGAETQLDTTAEDIHASHLPAAAPPRPESTLASPITLNPSQGQEIGAVFEAFLSPQQEGGEEEDTPTLIPSQFKSTAPSVARNDRPSRGHGILSFTNDLSRAYVHVAIEGVKVEEIVMFHIHCGRPGQLGPILVDFALMGDLQAYWADNVLTLAVTNEDIVATANHGEGLVGAFTAGCPIVTALPMDKVKTIAGMATIARQGELYFNLHTKGQTFFGDIRGQLQPVTR
ncbi:MAG: CHRD domain-containing protein [Caldilineaceae bacterium]